MQAVLSADGNLWDNGGTVANFAIMEPWPPISGRTRLVSGILICLLELGQYTAWRQVRRGYFRRLFVLFERIDLPFATAIIAFN